MKGLVKFRKILGIMFVVALVLMATQATPVATAAPPDNPVIVIPPEDAVAATGKTYGEWSAAWWQYVLSIPSDDNPLLDGTGAKCDVGQIVSNPVFFLVGTDVVNTPSITRVECKVSAGKFLFFPLVNIVYYKELNTENENNMRARLESLVQSAKDLHASIDGFMVSLTPHNTPFRTESPDGFFTVTVPEDAVFGIAPGSYDTVADGFYLMIAPLPPGPHTINFGGTSKAYGFELNVTYNLIVQP